MKEIILLITLAYFLPAGVVLKYGDKHTSMLIFVPVANVVLSTMIAGENTWKYIHER